MVYPKDKNKYMKNHFFRTSIFAILLLPVFQPVVNSQQIEGKVRFGICTDVHKDIMHDADLRLTAFVKKAKSEEPDFIIQLGDFCRPYDYNKDFLAIWNGFPGEKYHVLGNHETDGGFTRQDALDFLGCRNKFYSFDTNGFHFVVLDGNDVNPSPDKAKGYPRFIGMEQSRWLANDLKSTKYKTIIFSHQSLEGDGIENREDIRKILEEENASAGYKKVIACFSGHHHTDYATEINGIYYIQVNSMSYSWVGEEYARVRYSDETDKKFPWIKYTIPYKDPLFAFVEINANNIKIKGVSSNFAGPGPKELGMPERSENDKIVPFISSRKLKF